MPVIINDFEVVVEPPPQRQLPPNLAPATPCTPEAPALAPLDIREVMRQQMDRLARLWAH